jgi:hypothetical protein
MQMCVRALKSEFTHVKMLYLAMFSVALSGAALLNIPPAHSHLTMYQLFLLLACGMSCLLRILCSVHHSMGCDDAMRVVLKSFPVQALQAMACNYS